MQRNGSKEVGEGRRKKRSRRASLQPRESSQVKVGQLHSLGRNQAALGLIMVRSTPRLLSSQKPIAGEDRLALELGLAFDELTMEKDWRLEFMV